MSGFLLRAIVVPFILAGIALVSMFGFGLDPASQAAASGPSTSGIAPVVNVAAADVAQDMDGDLLTEMGADVKNCWEHEKDQWGRTATTAFVKDVGGVEIYKVSADKAFYDAAASKVWVLAWCE